MKAARPAKDNRQPVSALASCRYFCFAIIGAISLAGAPSLPAAVKKSAPTRSISADRLARAKALEAQVSELYRSGKYAAAIPPAQELLAIYEEALGTDHPDTFSTLNNLGTLYKEVGDYPRAEPIFQRSLRICEKAFGPEHTNTATCLNNLATLYMDMGDPMKAEPLFERSLRIWEKTLGPEHPNAAASLSNLAGLYEKMGDYAKAEPLYQQSLKIREKALGPEAPDTAASLNNLAGLYLKMGDFAKTEPLLERSLKIREKTLGPEHPHVAMGLHNLAVLHKDMGDYANAEPLYQRSLKIYENALGPEHPDTATSLNNLAELYRTMGDYAKAEPLYQRSLKIREKALGPDTPDTANSLNSLAALYREMGDHARAEPLCQRSLNLCEKTLGSGHPDTATALNNLALLYVDMRDYAKAEPLHRRSLKICEETLGPEHPNTASSLNNLAGLYEKMGDYARAEPLCLRSLRTAEKTLSPEHPDIATRLNNLATLYLKMGDYAKAEPLCRRSLKMMQKILGPDHPITTAGLNNLAALLWYQGRPAEAQPFASQAGAASEKTLSNILSFAPERQRLAYQEQHDPYSLFAMLEMAPELADALLRNRGIVLDSVLEDREIARASLDPRRREQVERLRGLKSRLIELTMDQPKELSPESLSRRTEEQERLTKASEELESALARDVAGLGRLRRALRVTVTEIQTALPRDTALIEFVRYKHLLQKTSDDRYGAVLIPPTGQPKWVPLGAAKDLDARLYAAQMCARGRRDVEALHATLRALHDTLWIPVEKILPDGTRTVILSPDSQLNFLSFATLLGPDHRFLSQKYLVRYVASGRDLLRDTKPTHRKRLSVFASPDFAEASVKVVPESSKAVAMRSLEARDFRGLRLTALPGTEREARGIEEVSKTFGWETDLVFGLKATETQLRLAVSPRILHLATHGFFLPDLEQETPETMGGTRSLLDPPVSLMRALKNPMRRSGLALAGAQATLNAWANGEIPPTDNDGMLTAEEVGGLNLEGTWLVTLSACETASGEASAGEGVLGLRRGFIQAGAQNLLMTLWPVADEETARFMIEFYREALKSGNAPEALAHLQRDWLVRLRKEKDLLYAVNRAGAFILNSVGKP